MVVVAPVLVPRDQIKDKKHLIWTTKVLMGESCLKPVFCLPRQHILNVLSTMKYMRYLKFLLMHY